MMIGNNNRTEIDKGCWAYLGPDGHIFFQQVDLQKFEASKPKKGIQHESRNFPFKFKRE